MNERLKIFVDQLRDGHIEKINETVAPDFFDVDAKELSFPEAIQVHGEAYLAEDMLVLHLDMETSLLIPCKICNESTKVKVAVKGMYHAEPLEEIKGSVFDYQELLRETILLEAPTLVECHQGNCPQRKMMKKYLKEESQKKGVTCDEVYRPFADLDIEIKN